MKSDVALRDWIKAKEDLPGEPIDHDEDETISWSKSYHLKGGQKTEFFPDRQETR